jgi:hypothetical protein
MAKKRARSASVSSEEETVSLRGPIAVTGPYDFNCTFHRFMQEHDGPRADRDRRDTLHVPEDGNQVQVPDEAASSSHDDPRDASLEAAAAEVPQTEDEKDLQRVIQEIEAQQQQTDRDNIME